MNLHRKASYLSLLAALGLSAALSANAADTKPANPASSANNAVPSAVAPTPGATAPRAATPATMGIAGVRASKLIGMNVTNAQGENLGEIEDLVVNTATGKVDYAVLEFGGFLGMGDKLVAYPLQQFKPAANDRGKLALNVDKAKLKDAPGFASKAWPDFNTGDYRAQVDRYHRYQSGTQPRFVRASDMLKGDVKDANRKDIGDIEDMVVDMSTGKIHFVAVEFDRAWNPIDKLVAMPLRALTSEDRDGTDLVYMASRDELRNAPTFDKSAWPDPANARFRSDFDRYEKQWQSSPQRTSQVAPR